jgi:integrase
MTLNNIRSLSLWDDERIIMEHQSLISIGPSPCLKVEFSEALLAWRENHVSRLNPSSQVRYGQVIDRSFDFFKSMDLQEIKSSHIDYWIQDLFKKHGLAKSKRQSFRFELTLLRSFFNFCREYYDGFQNGAPVKKRHFQNSFLNGKKIKISSKNLSYSEFVIFRKCLLKMKGGRILASLAVVQYFHALRISEASALSWEDIHLNVTEPINSFCRIQQHVRWVSKTETVIENGFKNSKAVGGFKDHPLFPQTYQVFLQMQKRRARRGQALEGLVFCDKNGGPLFYRKIQYAYDKAFKLAGLSYNATHILRHGGCRRLYEKNSDLEIAKQLLGNTGLKSTLVYAKKSNAALSKAVSSEWKKKSSKPPN